MGAWCAHGRYAAHGHAIERATGYARVAERWRRLGLCGGELLRAPAERGAGRQRVRAESRVKLAGETSPRQCMCSQVRVCDRDDSTWHGGRSRGVAAEAGGRRGGLGVAAWRQSQTSTAC